MFRFLAVLALVCGAAVAQRGSYAGSRPVGYPVITTSTTDSALDERFGEDSPSTPSTTTLRLPLEALGNRELFEKLSKLPRDKQPFWVLNWQALEENRKHPQSYDPNPNTFISPPPQEVRTTSTSKIQLRTNEIMRTTKNFRDPELARTSKPVVRRN